MRELHQSLRERDVLAGELRHVAFHDPLTHLADRVCFSARLQDALNTIGPATSRLTLMIVDLDDFKQVNDRFGHATGDELLVVAAQRLRNCVRDVDLVARLGGDEFAVLLEDLPTGRPDRRVVGRCPRPSDLDVTASVSASVGVVVSDGGRRTADAPNSSLRNRHAGGARRRKTSSGPVPHQRGDPR